MLKPWWLWWGTPVGAALGAALLLSPVAGADRVEIPLGDSPRRGLATAPVTMVEFVDFQ